MQLKKLKIEDTVVTFRFENINIPFIFKIIKNKTMLYFIVTLYSAEMRLVTFSGHKFYVLENSAEKNILKWSKLSRKSRDV